MNTKEIIALAYGCFYCIIRLSLKLADYINNNGDVSHIRYVYGSRSRTEVSWQSAFNAELFLNLICLFFIVYAFMPNWLTYLISFKNRNKINPELLISLQEKIKIFNEFHSVSNSHKLAEISTSGFYQSYINRINYWTSVQMTKVIEVYEYRRNRLLYFDELNNVLDIISFERRVDYLKFKDRPLRKQDTSTSWDYVQYHFVNVNGEWKLNYFEKDPSDMELFSYLFK